jgi:tetratricopeptide (TPR) repeat protein
MAGTAASMLLLAGLAARHFLASPAASNNPHALFSQAEKAITVRDYSLAITNLNQCLESWPFSAEIHFLLARTYRRAGRLGPAKAHLDRATVLQWPEQQIRLERQLRRAQTGDVWTIEQLLLDRLNTQPPEEVIILEALVQGLMQIDRLEDVLSLTSTWIERYPDDWLPLIYRGNAQLRLFGWTPEVEKDFDRLLELKPDHPEAHLAVAITMSHRGLFREALPHFQAAINHQADDINEALFGLADCQYSLSNPQEARATLRQLFERCQDDPPGFFLQAKIDLGEGRPEEALKWLEKAEALAPQEADITNTLVLVYRQLGKTKEAEEYSRLLEEIRTRDAELDGLAKLLKIRPNDIELRFQAALACLKYDRDLEAAHWFHGILTQNPNHQPTLKALFDYYKSHGNPKMAEFYRRKLARLQGGE